MPKKLKLSALLILSCIFINTSINIYAEETSIEISAENSTEKPSEQQPAEPDGPALIAEAAIMIDADTGIILYEKDCHRTLYPASITKILTTLLAIEYGKYDEIITHSHNAVYNIGPGSSHIGMRENEQITLNQALYGIMLESANEVCMAVAEHIAGDVDNFVGMMNKRAKELGALNSHFANPHGFHDDEHYTNCYDMAQFMKAAINQEKFIELISTLSYEIPPTNIVNEARPLNNKNKMIKPWSPYYYEYCVGGKTGYTSEAGNTLVTYGKKGDINLITVVMKDNGTAIYSDTKALLEYGFSMYSEKNIFYPGAIEKNVSVIQKYKDKTIDLGVINLRTAEAVTKALPDFIDEANIEQEISIPEMVDGPVKSGDTIGSILLKYNESTLAKVDILSSSDIELIPLEELEEQERREQIYNKIIFSLKIIGIISAALIVILIALLTISSKIRRNRAKKRRSKIRMRLK